MWVEMWVVEEGVRFEEAGRERTERKEEWPLGRRLGRVEVAVPGEADWGCEAWDSSSTSGRGRVLKKGFVSRRRNAGVRVEGPKREEPEPRRLALMVAAFKHSCPQGSE
jgi:hypothetical protein